VIEAFCKEKLAPLVLRLALGLACVYHGYLKIMAQGGSAWTTSLEPGWQLLIAWGEFIAGVAVLVGFRCRIAAVLTLLVTVGPPVWWHGWKLIELPLRTLEPTLLILLLATALLFQGAGDLSFDGRGGTTAAAKAARPR
jgi:uncharacterized membrane protein YphA (DoxX/SURF4 family)